MPGTVLGAEDSAMNGEDKLLVLDESNYMTRLGP